MRIDGSWLLCPDGATRPVLTGEVLASDGSWVSAPFLLDTGADRTVLSATVLQALALPHLPSPNRLAGLGGVATSVDVSTQIRLATDRATKVTFRGQFAAATALETLDMSVMGRDITDLLTVVVDRPGDTVCLLGPGHGYAIQPP